MTSARSHREQLAPCYIPRTSGTPHHTHLYEDVEDVLDQRAVDQLALALALDQLELRDLGAARRLAACRQAATSCRCSAAAPAFSAISAEPGVSPCAAHCCLRSRSCTARAAALTPEAQQAHVLQRVQRVAQHIVAGRGEVGRGEGTGVLQEQGRARERGRRQDGAGRWKVRAWGGGEEGVRGEAGGLCGQEYQAARRAGAAMCRVLLLPCGAARMHPYCCCGCCCCRRRRCCRRRCNIRRHRLRRRSCAAALHCNAPGCRCHAPVRSWLHLSTTSAGPHCPRSVPPCRCPPSVGAAPPLQPAARASLGPARMHAGASASRMAAAHPNARRGPNLCQGKARRNARPHPRGHGGPGA